MVTLFTIITVQWILPLPSDLWVDETGTVWTISGGFVDTLTRGIKIQLQAPLYVAIAWVARNLLGSSELALRIPSLLAAAGSVVVFRSLAARLLGPYGRLPATIIYAATGGVMFAASDARPYAFALFTLLGATLALTRWLDRGLPRHAVLYVTAAAATVYFQYMFAVGLIAHVLYLIFRQRRSVLRSRDMLLTAGVLAVALLPAMIHLSWVSGLEQAFITWQEDLSLRAFMGRLIPFSMLMAALGGLLVAHLESRPRFECRALDADARASLVLVVAMASIPTIVVYSMSLAVAPKFFVTRYLLSAAPGIALLLGWFAARIRPVAAQRFILAGIVVASVFGSQGWYHTQELWGEAAAIERAIVMDPRTPVLLHGGFIESKLSDWRTDPHRRGFILAPATAYRFEGTLIPSSFDLDADGRAYLNEVARRLRSERSFVFVTPYPWIPIRGWLDGFLASEGFTSRPVARAGSIWIYLFERKA